MDPKKSKPVTTSVPSISIKFHANVEEIEELHFSDDETPNSEEKSNQFGNLQPGTSSSDQDTSPLKLLPKLVKRSTSVDVTSNQSLSSSPPSDPWRFFSDIKGKITKSVEEKITEIKARHEEGSPSHRAKATKEGNKDNSSFSDSEDQSESSISRTCGFASTTEGVEMSSDDETSSLDKEKKLHSPSIRQRFRFLRQHNNKSTAKEGSVNINNFSKLYNINTERVEQALPEHNEDVESGVDALEETDFKKEDISEENLDAGGVMNEEIIKKVTEKIDNIEVDKENVVNIKQVTGEDIKKSFFTGGKEMTTVFAPTGFVDLRLKRNVKSNDVNLLPYILFSVYIIVYAIFHTYLPYLAGTLLGASLALVLSYLYVKLYTIPLAGDSSGAGCMVSKIMEIPAVKEHQPLAKYEGWMNEFPEAYDPVVYHISRTQSVFLRLQGNLLKISHSKSKVPKRAMWNEHDIKASFSHHRIYNLYGAKITLLPAGLTKVRLWSKKYPICVTLNKDQMHFDPEITQKDPEDDPDEKNSDKGKSPKNKKKFTFKKRDYQYLTQRFSKLNDDNDMDFDSDSRASTPSPEGVELSAVTKETALPADLEKLDNEEEEEMHSLPDESSDGSQNKDPEIKIYLFGRTDREKENWFRRLAAATHHTEESEGADSESVSERLKTEMDYMKYMTLFNKLSRKTSKQDEKEAESVEKDDIPEGSMLDSNLWFNVTVGRVLFDCIRDPGFTKKVQNRIQKKLQTIKLPYFIEEILITELSLGKTPPFILKTDKPVLDDRGLWVDLDISYEGSIVLTLQTKVNLMKLKNPQSGNDKTTTEIKSAIYHSDVDDTAESSSDEDGPQEIPVVKESSTPGERPHGSKKFIKMVDRIAESKFFQAAAENRYIKKAMEGVSNTELRLTVELKALCGTVVLNIPPPPSDRVWVGFRPVPDLVLTACPIVGERNVNYTMVTKWIEKKMLQEFEKVMVIPNMEDFHVPVMNPKLPD